MANAIKTAPTRPAVIACSPLGLPSVAEQTQKKAMKPAGSEAMTSKIPNSISRQRSLLK
jgi:hypothetical protein